MTWPVMKSLLCEAKNATSAATSSGLPRRFSGMFRVILASVAGSLTSAGGKYVGLST